jgi:type VI secretion system secreted protein Hcp
MAKVDYFLKIAGIDGESGDHAHKADIEVESWSWGESNAGTGASGGGHGGGKVSMNDFHFVMKTCKASPKLMLACADGEHFKDATLVCRKAGKQQQEFLKIKFTDLMVTSYNVGGSAHGEVVPMEQISMNFAKIEWEYKEQKPDGSLGGAVKAGWDAKSNKAV